MLKRALSMPSRRRSGDPRGLQEEILKTLLTVLDLLSIDLDDIAKGQPRLFESRGSQNQQIRNQPASHPAVGDLEIVLFCDDATELGLVSIHVICRTREHGLESGVLRGAG